MLSVKVAWLKDMQERLEQVEFYKNLSPKLKEEVAKQLNAEKKHIDHATIKAIDMEKGYDFLKDDHCFIEALNQMFYNERKRFHARISNIDGANDQFS